jgi:hypothetical protein
LLTTACGGPPAPEDVALAYGRAVYANDADAIWDVLSEADRRVKDRATLRRQQRQLDGFTRDAVAHLARRISATPVRTAITGDRAKVTLRFRVPDANAPAVRTLLEDWDEDRLNALGATEQKRILARLDRMHREGTLAVIEGEETIDLTRQTDGWRVFLNWAGGPTVRFDAAVKPGLPLAVRILPTSATLAPGERIRVSVRARNTGRGELRVRVAHRIDPTPRASHLALLECPLFVPVTLGPGETEEFTSEYLLLNDVPADVRSFAVRYEFARDAMSPLGRAGVLRRAGVLGCTRVLRGARLLRRAGLSRGRPELHRCDLHDRPVAEDVVVGLR